MKKELKIVLPFYKIAYASSFVVILSLIRGVIFTNEIGLSIEPPFAILTATFCADTVCTGNYKQTFRSTQTVSNKKENFFHHAANNDTGNLLITAFCSRIRTVFYISETGHTSSNRK
ncbi:MAG: hypothetical protein ACLSIF_07475 [Faecalimonas umbilicata]